MDSILQSWPAARGKLGSTKKQAAIDLLRIREGDAAKGVPVSAKIGRLRFEEAAADVVNDYRTSGKRSLDEVDRRISKHLAPFFSGCKMTNITTADVRSYVAHRQKATTVTRKAYKLTRKDGSVIDIPEQERPTAGVSNGEINRELTILKRSQPCRSSWQAPPQTTHSAAA